MAASCARKDLTSQSKASKASKVRTEIRTLLKSDWPKVRTARVKVRTN